MTFMGIVSFCDPGIMKGDAFWGVYRMEVGWMCGPIGDPKKGFKDYSPRQLHEFLDSIGKNRFEFITLEEARMRVLGVEDSKSPV